MVCALSVVCSSVGVDGYVAGCTWHAYIVLTSDAAKHDAVVVHNAEPRAPLIDVTDAVRNLTITGIKIDEQVRVAAGPRDERTHAAGNRGSLNAKFLLVDTNNR